jgi:hypothetical protein
VVAFGSWTDIVGGRTDAVALKLTIDVVEYVAIHAS